MKHGQYVVFTTNVIDDNVYYTQLSVLWGISRGVSTVHVVGRKSI